MNKAGFFMVGAAAAAAAVLIFAGCTATPDSEGRTRNSAIPLAEDVWADGEITPVKREQWFTFTATAGTQYIHVRFGMQADLYVQVYDSSNNPVGNAERFYGSGGSGRISFTLTIGKRYYIQVTQGGSSASAYWIGFNALPLPPGTRTSAAELTENIWADGEITSTNKEQWFTFTATAGTRYLHIIFNTLTDITVQFYNSDGSTHTSEIPLNDSDGNRYTSLGVISGQVYYVRVIPSYSSGSGTYRIAVNVSTTAPN